MVFLLPPVLLFGAHIIIVKIPDMGYLTLSRAYWVIMVIFTLAYVLSSGISAIKLKRTIRYVVMLAVLVMYSLVSLRFAINWQDSVDEFMFQLAGLATVFYICTFCESFEDLKKFLRVLTVCLVVTALIGIYEMYSGNYLFSPGDAMLHKINVYGHGFPCAEFYNTNDLASFLTIFTPFAVFAVNDFMRGTAGKIIGFFIGFLISVFAFMDLLGGRARISFVVSIVMSAILLIICILIKNYRKYALQVVSFILGLPSAEFILRLTSVKHGTLMTKIHTINMQDHSVNERLTILIGGLRMSAAHLLFGVGVGNSVPLLPQYAKVRAINLHNMPLEILAEFGIFVFALYVVMLILLARDFLKKPIDKTNRSFFCIFCFIVLLAFQIESMQPSDAMHISALWMAFGILFAADNLFCAANSVNGNNCFYNFRKRFGRECR